jgi:hypothetical protein
LARRDRKRSLNDGRIQNPSNPFGIVPLSNFLPRGFGFVHHSIAFCITKCQAQSHDSQLFFIAARCCSSGGPVHLIRVAVRRARPCVQGGQAGGAGPRAHHHAAGEGDRPVSGGHQRGGQTRVHVGSSRDANTKTTALPSGTWLSGGAHPQLGVSPR